MTENAITIELSKAQINRVIREADEDDGLLGLLRLLGALRLGAGSVEAGLGWFGGRGFAARRFFV